MHWNDRYVLAYFVQFSAAIAVCLAYIPIKGLVEVIVGVLLILSLPWVMFSSSVPCCVYRTTFAAEQWPE